MWWRLAPLAPLAPTVRWRHHHPFGLVWVDTKTHRICVLLGTSFESPFRISDQQKEKQITSDYDAIVFSPLLSLNSAFGTWPSKPCPVGMTPCKLGGDMLDAPPGKPTLLSANTFPCPCFPLYLVFSCRNHVKPCYSKSYLPIWPPIPSLTWMLVSLTRDNPLRQPYACR